MSMSKNQGESIKMLAYAVPALLMMGNTVATKGSRGRNNINLQKKLFMNSKQSTIGRDGRQLQNSYNNNYVAAEGNAAEETSEYGFMPANYALSYSRCAAVQQFDDEVARSQDTNTVLATKNFAIFRFCPADTCDAPVYDFAQGGGGRRLQQNSNAYAGQGQAQQNEVLYGARGSGCQSDYGEYMIELEDYLQIMAEYQQEQAEEYCSYCEDYMYTIYQKYVAKCQANGNCRNRHLQYEDFRKDSSGDVQRELGFNFGICMSSSALCDGQNALENEMAEYFECKEANGVYIGPHCAEDGFTVTLGVFSDMNCNVYLGDNAANFIGEDLEEDALKNWYNSRYGMLSSVYEGEEDALCFSCKKVDTDFEQMNLSDDQTEEETVYGDNEMSELCEMVYESSAHCPKNMADISSSTWSKSQMKEMQLSCSYIDSVLMGNYDEMGYVNLKNSWNFDSETSPEWLRDVNQRRAAVSDVSPLQIFFLVVAILACITLATWSKSLHTSLTTSKEPWAPRRSWNLKSAFRRKSYAMDQPGISPIDSGIGASRVRSEGTSYYLS